MKLLPAQDKLVFVATSDPEEAAMAILEGCVALNSRHRFMTYGLQFLREDSKPSEWLILGLDPDGHCLVMRGSVLKDFTHVSRVCALLGVK